MGFHDTSINHPRVKIKEGRAVFKIHRSNATKIRDHFRQLKKHQPLTMRAICHLILIDYICFPEYNLPPQCQFLEGTLMKGKSLLER